MGPGSRSRRLVGSLVAALALASAAACGAKETDPCDTMVKHLQECGLQGSGGGFNCNGSAACAADCVTNATCEEIKTNGPDLTACLDACGPSQ